MSASSPSQAGSVCGLVVVVCFFVFEGIAVKPGFTTELTEEAVP
jgi:hypothetical protein